MVGEYGPSPLIYIVHIAWMFWKKSSLEIAVIWVLLHDEKLFPGIIWYPNIYLKCCHPSKLGSVLLNYFSFELTLHSLPDDKIVDWYKLKQFADNTLKCISNEKHVPYRVENIVRKREIACYKQFLLFSQCFPQLYILGASKCGILW